MFSYSAALDFIVEHPKPLVTHLILDAPCDPLCVPPTKYLAIESLIPCQIPYARTLLKSYPNVALLNPQIGRKELLRLIRCIPRTVTSLRFCGAPLSALDIQPILRRFRRLELLALRRCDLGQMIPKAMGYPRLFTLDVSHSRIFPANLLEALPSIKRLECWGCVFTLAPVLSAIKRCRVNQICGDLSSEQKERVQRCIQNRRLFSDLVKFFIKRRPDRLVVQNARLHFYKGPKLLLKTSLSICSTLKQVIQKGFVVATVEGDVPKPLADALFHCAVEPVYK